MPSLRDPTSSHKSEAPDPKPKMADWSEYEELMVFVYAKKFKCKWIQVTKKFPQRSKIAVRNKFINSLTDAKFDLHNAMFRKLIVGRTAQDLGKGLANSQAE